MATGLKYFKLNPLRAILPPISTDPREQLFAKVQRSFITSIRFRVGTTLIPLTLLDVKAEKEIILALKDINKWTNWESDP